MSGEIELASSSSSSSSGERACRTTTERGSTSGSAPPTTERGSTSGSAPVNTHVPFVIYNDKDCYKALRPIGTTATGVTVYQSTFFPQDSSIFEAGSLHDAFVAIQVVHESNQQLQDNLLVDILRNRHCNHWNILPIKNNFVHEGNLCAVMPLNEITSLRNVMRKNSNFNGGLPENCIAIALRETLYGLSRIHNMNQVHKKISAGNIFFHLETSSIKLSYGASTYDRYDDIAANEASSSSALNLSTIFQWAAAPEVYESSDDHASHTVKSDIWLIGILALELAYGGVRVNTRQELERLAEGIRFNRRLPNKGEELNFSGKKNAGKKVMNFIREKMQETGNKMSQISFELPGKPRKAKPLMIKEYSEEDEEKKRGKKVMNFIKGNMPDVVKKNMPDVAGKGKEVMNVIKEKIPGKNKKKERSFSKSFGKMVAECLARDPKKRPTVMKLVKHKFFKNSRSVKYFEDTAIMKDEFVTNWNRGIAP